jgi:hypothetical protein
MIRGPLPDRIEYAILDIIMRTNGSHQGSWAEWTNSALSLVADLDDAEFEAAFNRLRKRSIILLLNGSGRYNPTTEEDISLFFYTDRFKAIITDEGRSHWGHLKANLRNGVFISHITQETPVAIVLQKYLRLAFGDDFRVFVSSDAKSIGGGKKWYTHIIENLRVSEVVLVLVSQESKGREWINFEAGFGEGLESLVVPIGINQLSLGQLSFPLAGLQARSIGALGPIVDDIADRIGVTPNAIDAKAYVEELEEAEAQLIYKSLKVEPVLDKDMLSVDIRNIGNTDLELLMLDVYVPESVSQLNKYGVGQGVTMHRALRDGIPNRYYSCCSMRGTFDGIPPILRPVITPSMGRVRPNMAIPVNRALTPELQELHIYIQLHATGYRTEEERFKIADIPSWRNNDI